MGLLLKVLARAGPSVLIFSMVAMIPCVGLALSYHVAFGQSLKSYATVYTSLSTLMRMSVGDFDFDEIYLQSPGVALLLFWVSALLISFVLM